MKVFAVALAATVLGADGAAVKTRVASFGPQNCVALTRSTAGTCVIATNCEGTDLSQVEFAFDCVAGSGIVRHSFGTGGFEANEEFDTEVKCKRCESPEAADVVVQKPIATPVVKAATIASPVVQAAPEVPKAAVVFKVKRRHSVDVAAKAAAEAKVAAEAKAKMWPFDGMMASKKKPAETVAFGPNGCVSTWKSQEGHCMIKTDCKKSDISKYEFGLVCVDKVGSPVRHLFGKDSFDKEETFDTLIKCDKCLGLEDIPDEVALNGEVVTMSKDISNLKDVMKNISINVQMLNEEVFKKAPGPAPAAAAPAPAAAVAKPANLFLHARRHHRHHRNEDYDDEDEDDEDDVSGKSAVVAQAVVKDDTDGDDASADGEDALVQVSSKDSKVA